MAYSYSAIRLFQQCPKAFKLERILKFPQLPSKERDDGRLVHDAIAGYTKHLWENKLASDVTWEHLTDDLALSPEAEELMEDFARQFALNLDTFKGAEIEIAINEKGERVDWWDDDVFFRAKIDRLDVDENRVLITDYKTSHIIELDKLQLKIYAWLVNFLNPERDTFLVKNHFLRFRVEKGGEIPLSKVKLVGDEVKKFIDVIEAEKKFEAKPGSHCSYCSYTHRCGLLVELGKGGYPVIDSEEKAVEYAAKLVIVEAALKKVKDLLKGWCEDKGLIKLDVGTYGFNLTKSRKVKDIEVFYEKLAEQGINPLDYMNVDLRKIKKLKDLDDLFEETGSTKFGFKKTGGRVRKGNSQE